MLFEIFVGLLLLSQCKAASSYIESSTSSSDNSLEDDKEGYLHNSENWSDTFDWSLLKIFSSKYRNILLSPISLKIVLALLYEGATSTTERELQNVLQFSLSKDEVRETYMKILDALKPSERREYVLNLGTRIFLDSEMHPQRKYANKAKQIYDTDIEPTNFSYPIGASHTINSWVDKLTNGRVSEIVKPGDVDEAIMVIANAIFFKGTWRQQFPKNQTHLGGFYVSQTQMVTGVEYMTTTDKFYYHESSVLDAKILRLPYKGKRYSLYIILPNSKGGIEDLVKKVNLQVLANELFHIHSTLVEVRIPKFKFNFQTSFTKVLHDMGVKQMFQNTSSFPGIIQGGNEILRRLVVTDIIQKSGIELDEEGSVVYAATEVTIGNKFGEPQDVFNATHPFLFFIEEETSGTILFVGKVGNPFEANSIPSVTRDEVIDNKNSFDDGSRVPPPSVSAAPSSLPPVLALESSPNLQPIFPVQEALATRFNYFDIDLLEEFSQIGGNVFASPASIKVTLAMILEGAKGICAKEIGDALRISNINQNDIRAQLRRLLFDLNDKSSSTILESANGIFVSDKFKVIPSYGKKMVEDYSATIRPVDFTDNRKSSFIINSWAENATHGIIKNIAGELFSETTVLLANALYFKGAWKTEFDPKATKTKCFYVGERCRKVPMMQVSETFNYNFNSALNADVIDLPYEDEKYAMLLLIPRQSVQVLANDLTHENLKTILSNLKPTELVLEMPRFEIEYSADLIEFLKPLNIREIFGTKANLTGMIHNDNVKINNIVHKTKIEVNELGTKAAAATSAVVIPLMGSTSLKITADKPFIFFIYHTESTNIIFMGIYNEPENESSIVTDEDVILPEQIPTRVKTNIPRKSNPQNFGSPSYSSFRRF